MKPPNAARGLRLFRIAGIDVHVDVSWLIIFVLVLWSLSVGYFPGTLAGLSSGAYWLAGLAATLLLFASILLHEVAHAVVASWLGIPTPVITLFLFGGLSQMEAEPEEPGRELAIAAVGPAASIALALTFWAFYAATAGGPPTLGHALLGYLAAINGALAVFNLLPGYPLDGGRVLRALLAWWTGSYVRATRTASIVGQGLAIGLMVLGALDLFSGALVGGVWLILIGLFLRGMAIAGFQDLVIRHALQDVTVGDVMLHDVVTVGPDLPLRRLVDDYILVRGHRAFPVVDHDRVMGTIALEDVQAVPEAERTTTRVGDRMHALEPGDAVGPDESLVDAMRQMARQARGRLLVMHDGVLDGMLTRSALARFVELRQALHPADAPR